MPATTRSKEEFYIRRLFDDDVPVFVEATRYARLEQPYTLSAKKSLKATCAVRTDDEVVAFSLRGYTAKQVEKEVEHVEAVVDGKTAMHNLLRPRMPRKTLHDLTEAARDLAPALGDDVIVDLDGDLYVLTLARAGTQGELALVGKLTRGDGGYTRTAVADAEFQLPVTGVRLRLFMRSPVRERVLAYGFSGYLTRRPGESETVTRAAALALNNLLGLATFRMLSGLQRVEVPARQAGAPVRQRSPEERVLFEVPVLLFTDDEIPAARGFAAAEIDLDHIDPESGGLRVHIGEGDRLEWNPAVAGTVSFEAFRQVLADTTATMVHSVLGEEALRDLAYDIMLSDAGTEVMTRLRAATTGLPGLAATPRRAEVRQAVPATGTPAA
ncbi:hypothetical protein [Actinomadura violacea]|uniref:Uncharacterized protein n=1 Tax=Actinomadura violacea TaxID=2819934 RepID=A0ABS3SAW6_9ACTN|nr:hypothetical protein [Actinomadura violacea]MBO2465324.1 hypothetical protein [Actinomadura violacea]